MAFYLSTGYGIGQTGYDNDSTKTKDDPTYSSGQGNGTAPSGCESTNTLMIDAYRRLAGMLQSL
eukprot:scaffold128750_cov68-Cyclotella_meneghiniana.AAC.1